MQEGVRAALAIRCKEELVVVVAVLARVHSAFSNRPVQPEALVSMIMHDVLPPSTLVDGYMNMPA